MSKVKIDIITKVHIGSGEKLQYGSDFFYFEDDEGKWIGIISPRKILQLIGNDPKAINAWVTAIERRKPLMEFMRIYAPKAIVDDYCSRIDTVNENVNESDTLLESIHNGLGKPYIPGSSIKGAIRTAILSDLAYGQKNLKTLINFRKINATKIENKLFGDDPKKDVFRFLRVGDATFGNHYEENVVKLVNINERRTSSFWDTTKPQLVETLIPKDTSTCTIEFDYNKYKFASDAVHKLPENMSSLNTIFTTINKHTERLLSEEIKYWTNLIDEPNADKVDEYVACLVKIMNEVEVCKSTNGNSCILRLGAGSGWRFITGAWAETFEDFNSQIVPSVRRNNQKYSDYKFPKSRRVDRRAKPLGFIRLTLLD